jgi:hypothetical protein
VVQAAAAADATHATQAAQQQLQPLDADAQMEDAAAPATLHPSVAALDAALLQSDSVVVTTTSQGAQNALFHWDDHPQLGSHFDALVARMHSDAEQAQLNEVELLPTAVAAAVAAPAKAPKEKEKAAAKSSKKKTAAAADASPSLNGKHAHAPESNGADAMEVDDGEPAPAVAKKSRKSTKNKQ